MTFLLPEIIRWQLDHEREYLLDCVRGETSCDWHIRGGTIVNVLTGEIYPADLWLARGWIVQVTQPGGKETYPFNKALTAERVFDAKGKLVLPGFVDAHVHIESTMLTPYSLGQVLAKTGTTAILHDPHEIVNVAGLEGFQFMWQSAQNSPIHQYPLIPSCIPAVPELESAGAIWESGVIDELLNDGIQDIVVAGLAEVMDYIGLIKGQERISEIVRVATRDGIFVQGHVLGARGRSLAAYLLAGVQSNHESLTAEDIKTALRAGLHIDLRLTSSLVHDEVRELLAGIKLDRYHDQVSVCTDDVHIRDILAHGHLNVSVGTLIKAGVAPVTAVRMATLNTWREYGVSHVGALAPGYQADLQILPGLEETLGEWPEAVFVAGELVVEQGALTKVPLKNTKAVSFEQINTVDLEKVTAERFLVKSADRKAQTTVINVMNAGKGIQFALERVEIPVKDGYLSLEGHPELTWVFVFNRYGHDNVGIGILKDYSLKEGVIASTVSHDSHNLTVVFKQRDLAADAVNHLIDRGGGIVYLTASGSFTTVPLEVGGLMSASAPEEVAQEIEVLDRVYRHHNGAEANFAQVVTLALPVIPRVRMTDVYGLVDTVEQKPLPLEIGKV